MVFHFVVVKGKITKVAPDICSKKRLAVTSMKVDRINQQGLSWTAELRPELVGRTYEDFGMGMQGGIPPPRPESPAPVRRDLVDMPEAYDARDTYPDQIQCKAFIPQDQGGCGSCYAFSATAALGARICRATNSSMGNVILSAQQAMDCTNGCKGGTLQTVYALGSIVDRECKPYSASQHTCGGGCADGIKYTWDPSTIQYVGGPGVEGNRGMQYELMVNGPGIVGLAVYDDFCTYSKGVYKPSVGVVFKGMHAMSLVGWGVDNGVPYWLLQNSWGVNWGEKGFVRFARGIDACYIESYAGLAVVKPIAPTLCPDSRCAFGAVTLSDCTCRCDNGGTGPNCELPPCQNGGRPGIKRCVCGVGYSGQWCETAWTFTPKASYTGNVTFKFSSTARPFYKNDFPAIYTAEETDPWKYLWFKGFFPWNMPYALGCSGQHDANFTVPGRYKWVWNNALNPDVQQYPPITDSKVMTYFTIFLSTSSPGELQAATIANDPTLQQLWMTTRLDAALPFKQDAVSMGNITSDIQPDGIVWLDKRYQFCFDIPFRLNANPKGLRLFIGSSAYFIQILLPEDLQACINLTVSGKFPPQSLTAWVTNLNTGNRLLKQSLAFQTKKWAVLLADQVTQDATKVVSSFRIGFDKGQPHPWDIVRLIDASGIEYDWMYAYCGCKTQPTSTSTYSGPVTRSFTVLKASAVGMFGVYYYSAILKDYGATLPPGYIPWDKYGIAQKPKPFSSTGLDVVSDLVVTSLASNLMMGCNWPALQNGTLLSMTTIDQTACSQSVRAKVSFTGITFDAILVNSDSCVDIQWWQVQSAVPSAYLNCTRCAPGTVPIKPWIQANSTCVPCPEDQYESQSECLPCPPGTYSAAGAATCLACPAETLWVQDGNRLIRSLNIETGEVRTVAGNFTAPAGQSKDGVGRNASFAAPAYGLAFSPDGSYALSLDIGANKLQRINTRTLQVQTVLGAANTTKPVYGVGTAARLYVPTSFAAVGNLGLVGVWGMINYVNLTTMAYSPWVGGSPGAVVNGVGTSARLGTGNGFRFAITPDGSRVYVSDSGFIRMITVATRNVVSVAGNGTQATVDGTGPDARVTNGVPLAVDPDSQYLVFYENFVLRKMDLDTLEITTVLGQPGVSGYADGIGNQATLSILRSMAFNSDGSNLILGTTNGGIRIVTTATWRVAHLTYHDATNGYVDGTAGQAMFKGPNGLALVKSPCN